MSMAIEELGCRRAAQCFRIAGGAGPTVSRVLGDLLAQAERSRVADGAVAVRTYWSEEARMADLGLVGRRYSGAAHLEPDGHIAKLLERGLCSGLVGISSFALPGWLRNACRAGLPHRFVLDIENAHPVLLLQRHPHLHTLRAYVEHREDLLRQVHQDRAAAKELFLVLLYGGSAQGWMRRCSVAQLPAWVGQLEAEFAQAREADVAAHPDLFERVKTTSAKPVELLQYVLNTKLEREVLDAICGVVEKQLAGTVLAWEHDGAYVYCRRSAAEIKEAVEREVKLSVKARGG